MRGAHLVLGTEPRAVIEASTATMASPRRAGTTARRGTRGLAAMASTPHRESGQTRHTRLPGQSHGSPTVEQSSDSRPVRIAPDRGTRAPAGVIDDRQSVTPFQSSKAALPVEPSGCPSQQAAAIRNSAC